MKYTMIVILMGLCLTGCGTLLLPMEEVAVEAVIEEAEIVLDEADHDLHQIKPSVPK